MRRFSGDAFVKDNLYASDILSIRKQRFIGRQLSDFFADEGEKFEMLRGKDRIGRFGLRIDPGRA